MGEMDVYFKEQRQAEEFPLVSPHLRGLVLDVAFYAGRRYGKFILITELLRSQEEQDQIYNNDSRYRRRAWKSVHQFGRGADIRIRNFTAVQQRDILDYVTLAWPYDPSRPEFPSVSIHDIGLGRHLHLQVLK